jgi:putative PIG3 family NAD(P)H quinone oxidoreductase
MRAVVISEPGGPEVLQWHEVPQVTPGPREVVIDVAAAGVNRADVQQRKGVYPPPKGASEYPGLEVAGQVVAVGEAVTRWRTGDEVCALLSGGGYAEQVAIDESLVLPIPEGLPVADAAALVEVAATVYSNVAEYAGLSAHQSLLVHGGAGGIGTFAIQWAKALGATVFTTARPDNHAALREFGADVTIDYRDEDFVAVIAEHTGGAGVDVILDNMGAAYLNRNVEALAVEGRLAVIGLQGGRTGELNLGAMLAKRATIQAAGLRSRPQADRAAILDGVLRHVWPLVASGQIRPVVAQRIPMPEAAKAHRLMEAGGHLGKFLLIR